MLGELEQKWVSHPINLIKQANSTPWYLGINPRGVVPVLVHDGVVHVESNDIITYLNTTFSKPGNSYFFDTSSTAAAEAQQLLDLEESLHMDLRLLTIEFGPLSLKSKDSIDAQEKNGNFDAKRAHEVEWWREKAENGISDSETCAAAKNFSTAFNKLDQRLAEQPWIMGDKISIIDISWFPNVQRLINMGYPMSRHKNLSAYYQRLISRPSFKAELSQPGSRFGKLLFGGIRFANRIKGKSMERCL